VIDQGSLVEIEHPVGGLMRYPKPPFNFSSQDSFPKTHSPSLGQHNREILSNLGVEEETIKRMEEREKMNADMLKQMAELAAQQDA
jgi:crotonobetainyl-CoA:carnitine CoA-transferase CaiB-like acyl-CoA transferase